MLRPPSKPADMYNYRVATYLKTSTRDLKIPGLASEDLNFTVIPKSIPRENSFLNVEILFDIIISGSEHEYLCECKHHQIPRPLTLNSVELKDSLLEFIAAEKYRINSIKRDGIAYLLITNCSIAKLSKEMDHLKTGSDSEVIKYSELLTKRASEKWKNFDTRVKIEVKWIRNVLMRLIPLEIDEGRLSEASKSTEYEQEFRKIMDQLSRASPSLVPLEYRVKNTIRFITKKDNEDTVDVQKGGYLIEISRVIANQLLSYKLMPAKHFVKADYHEVPFVESCEILHHSSMSAEKSMELVVETLNDIIEQRFVKPTYFVVVNPGTYDVYFADLEWFYKIVTNSVNAKGFYDIAKIMKELPTGISRFALANLVKESLRLKANTIVRQDLMDFLGIDEADYPY